MVNVFLAFVFIWWASYTTNCSVEFRIGVLGCQRRINSTALWTGDRSSGQGTWHLVGLLGSPCTILHQISLLEFGFMPLLFSLLMGKVCVV